MAPWIIRNMPTHKVYVEPFGGGASVLMQKPPATTEVYNDLDSEVVNLFRILRDDTRSARLATLLSRTPFSRDEYQAAYAPCPELPLEQARRTVVKSFMGMSSKGIWSRSGFDSRVNTDGYISRKTAFQAVPEELERVAKRLMAVVIENRDYLQILDIYDNPEVLFYVDPPYEHSTHATRVYRHRDVDHRALAGALHQAKGMVMLSGYRCELYDELFGDWLRVDCDTFADTAKKRTESLWFNPAAAKNRPQPSLLEAI